MREDWIEIGYKEVVNKISTNNKKLKQKEYLQKGAFPVIDQGQELVGGYTDDEDKLLDCELPAIVFGDHTKIIKLINFKFASGADGTKVLEPKKFVLPKYLSYLTQILVVKIKDKGYARHYQHLERQPFPIAPLPEQRAIVSKIEQLFSELDHGIANLKAAKAKLEIYRQAVLKKAFEGELTKEWRKNQNGKKTVRTDKSDFNIAAERSAEYNNGLQSKAKSKGGKDLPKGWEWVKLEGVVENIEAGKSFRCEERTPSDEEVGVLKVSSVSWGEFLEEESKTVIDASRINSKYFVNSGDFLFSRANTIELVGKAVIVKSISKSLMLSDKTLRINFKENVRPHYILWFLRTRLGRLQIESLSTGNQASMRNIGQSRIKQIEIPYPDFNDEQNKVVHEIESRLSVCDKLSESIDQSLEQSEALRQSILKKAFAGELLSTEELQACRKEPDWESAEKLVARIKESRNEFST